MSGKKPEGIPLAALIAGKGFKRNYDIEFKEALDETLHRDAIDGAKHKAAQRAKAQKPRGAGDDGRTMRQVIASIMRLYPSETDLWPHIQSAIEANGMKPISEKHARAVVLKIRRATG